MNVLLTEPFFKFCVTFFSECSVGLALLHGVCVSSCPDTYFVQNGGHPTSLPGVFQDAADMTRVTYICLPCHYSCRTCSGPNDFQCLTCHDDANLHRKEHDYGTVATHCYPGGLMNNLNSNYFWYKALLVTLVINVAVVIFLVFYICFRKKKDESRRGHDGNWYSRESRPYRRISPDENNPSGDDEHGVLGVEIDSNVEEDDDEFFSDSNGIVGSKELLVEVGKNDSSHKLSSQLHSNIINSQNSKSPAPSIALHSFKSNNRMNSDLVQNDSGNVS